MPIVISLQNVIFSWQKNNEKLIDISNMQIKKNEHTFIYGNSGSGKTTLLSLLSGINTPSSGSIEVLNKDITMLPNIQRDNFRVNHMGIIFQQFNLLPYLSLIENIELPCMFSKKRNTEAGSIRQTALHLLEALKIPIKLANTNVLSLSIGQQQRVAIARALIGNPEIIIADEPTSALDKNNSDIFLDLLFEQANTQGSTIIFVSHNLDISNKFSKIIELK